MKQKAFTLIELLITITIAGILLLVGVPGLMDFIESSNLKSQTNSIAGALNLARSNAITTGIPTNICPASDNSLTACGTDWNNPIIVYENFNNTPEYDNNTDEIIETINAAEKSITRTSTSSNNIITFADLGISDSPCSLVISNSSQSYYRRITINHQGTLNIYETPQPQNN